MSVTKTYIDDPGLKIYFGTSTERGNMSTTGLTIGSKFYESDNNLELVWTGAGWVSWLLHTVA